jgi:hypothetical protein
LAACRVSLPVFNAVRRRQPPSVQQMRMRFRATIALLGVNPYVCLPPARLKALLAQAGRTSGAVPVQVQLGGAAFRSNLVKYAGAWRLYLNMPMRRAAGKDVGDSVLIELELDREPRVEPMPPKLQHELDRDAVARAAFAELTVSRRKEILRYLNAARTSETLERNVAKVLAHLRGESAPGLVVLAPRSSRGKTARAPRKKTARAPRQRTARAARKKARGRPRAGARR